MARRRQCETVTFTTTGSLATHQYKFVYQNGANTVTKAVDAQNGATGNVYILQNAPAAGELAECAVLGTGQSLLSVDGALSAGDGLMISTGSQGKERAGANKYIRAIVDEAATAADDVIVVNTVNPIFVTT